MPKRKFRERDQLEHRRYKGFLEKKQDYKERADDFKKKKEKYNKLIESTRTKNPDEFYYSMLKEEKLNFEKNDDTVSKYVNLVNHKISILQKKISKEADTVAAFNIGNKQHKVFVDSLEDVEKFSKVEYFNSEIDNPMNRLTKAQLETIEFKAQKEKNEEKGLNPQNIINMKSNLDKLCLIREGINQKRIEKQLGKKRKTESGEYRFFRERKK